MTYLHFARASLPANFMLWKISSTAPGFEAVVQLLQGGRRPSTVKSYDQEWIKFEAFTSQVQDDAGAPRMSVLPVSSQTVVVYLDYLLLGRAGAAAADICLGRAGAVAEVICC